MTSSALVPLTIATIAPLPPWASLLMIKYITHHWKGKSHQYSSTDPGSQETATSFQHGTIGPTCGSHLNTLYIAAQTDHRQYDNNVQESGP